MDAGLVLAVGLVYLFAFTNGVHDAANAIATLVATRSGRPGPALLTATAAMLAGPLLVGAAVADTIAGLVRLGQAETVETVTAALVGALVWNLLAWYRGLPSSATHALVGGLAGAAAASSGPHAIEWGSLQGWRPAGVLGVAVALVASPLLGALACLALLRALRRGLRRATRRFRGPVRHAQWPAAALLALGQGANDAQKAVGVVALVLAAEGVASPGAPPGWAVLGAALAMAGGTALGGWRIVRTIGRRIYPLRPLDSLASQAASAAVIVGASVAGAPISSTHVVASSVVGAGLGRERWRRVRWAVVQEMALAWAMTVPATAALGALAVWAWRAVT